jgi:hypothetical protein
MVDGKECSILAAVDWGSVAWTGLELEVEHAVFGSVGFASGVWVGILFISVGLIFFRSCSWFQKRM